MTNWAIQILRVFGQNNIERRRPLYSATSSLFPYFSSPAFFLFHFFLRIKGTIFAWYAPARNEGVLAFTFITYIFFCLIRLVKHDVLNTKAPGVPGCASPKPGFSYFTSISTSAARHTSTRKVGHSDTRAEFIQQVHDRTEGIYVCW